jgi:hypothetical protein
VDPDGNFLINNVKGNVIGLDGREYTARDYATLVPRGVAAARGLPTILAKDDRGSLYPQVLLNIHDVDIEFENGLTSMLKSVERIRDEGSRTTTTSVRASASQIGDSGIFQLDLTVTISITDPLTGDTIQETTTGTIAFATYQELILLDPYGVNGIANQVLALANINVMVDE